MLSRRNSYQQHSASRVVPWIARRVTSLPVCRFASRGAALRFEVLRTPVQSVNFVFAVSLSAAVHRPLSPQLLYDTGAVLSHVVYPSLPDGLASRRATRKWLLAK